MKSLIQRRSNPPPPLGEIQHNNQQTQSASRLPPAPMPRDARSPARQPPDSNRRGRSPAKGSSSPTKSAFGTLSLKVMANGGSKSREPSPTKPKKSTNLTGFLNRPKSLRNLHKLLVDTEKVQDDEAARRAKDKENRSPTEANGEAAITIPTPIFAQFARPTSRDGPQAAAVQSPERAAPKARPKSFHPHYLASSPSKEEVAPSSPTKIKGTSSWDRSPVKPSRPKLATSFAHARSKSHDASAHASATSEPHIDPHDIDKHLEAMLNRRNIPENQRYKMRNLNATIKMEFIRQDWAEMASAKTESPKPVFESEPAPHAETAASTGSEREEKKRSRGRSFTLTRGSKGSSGKKAKEGTLGRHFRGRSTESIAPEQPISGHSVSSTSSGILSKIKLGQGPGDFVAYLRKVTSPQAVEVGKLHKLRLLLRNETVSWTEEFIQLGGMKEIVGLLYRIMEVEWREEHEDTLLHETLLCLKALSTTALALEYIHSIQDSLFPKLLFMIFDPEKKGPSEFTTRNIITTVLFTYIESAPPAERPARAETVLSHLRDPQPPEAERPLPFVMDMWRERPYRVWCKEATNVTKEVFWIFLHHLNIVALPSNSDAPPPSANPSDPTAAGLEYMARHFPQERPPVAAAPYVGGVEWDATNYLASHLDLVNAILACTPTRAARNAFRSDLRVSGWERCLGGSLRLCKEKFYGAVHEGLRTWVAAAAEDGWDVRSVRYGPPPEPKSPVKAAKKEVAAPKIEMPKLDFGLEAGGGGGGGTPAAADGPFWLS
ncbi:uncharacterized protein DNG_07638 [Cephalotrichum gorgonifer]|uniref:Formin GTPase-binding domain-containing protein n=1 Tax=Cephalotrichum gorgonifer TaxID=2041049 RepID=A0AAE8N3X4_9PEZI|nr:uncharacterized protein DNG_07638 [Cephalotrichum gorgonifer]